MIKTLKLIDRGQTYRDDPFLKMMLQRRINKTHEDIGPLVKNCNCKKCFAVNVLINNIMMLAISFNIDELEYEEVVSHARVRKRK